MNLGPEVDETTKATVRVGELTCHKAEPASIARSMRISENSDGSLLFDASEFLTPRQIANFFFRLSAKRVLPTYDGAEDEILRI